MKDSARPYRDLGSVGGGAVSYIGRLGLSFFILDATDLQIVQRSKH